MMIKHIYGRFRYVAHPVTVQNPDIQSIRADYQSIYDICREKGSPGCNPMLICMAFINHIKNESLWTAIESKIDTGGTWGSILLRCCMRRG